jgi:hypothetical protein
MSFFCIVCSKGTPSEQLNDIFLVLFLHHFANKTNLEKKKGKRYPPRPSLPLVEFLDEFNWSGAFSFFSFFTTSIIKKGVHSFYRFRPFVFHYFNPQTIATSRNIKDQV